MGLLFLLFCYEQHITQEKTEHPRPPAIYCATSIDAALINGVIPLYFSKSDSKLTPWCHGFPSFSHIMFSSSIDFNNNWNFFLILCGFRDIDEWNFAFWPLVVLLRTLCYDKKCSKIITTQPILLNKVSIYIFSEARNPKMHVKFYEMHFFPSYAVFYGVLDSRTLEGAHTPMINHFFYKWFIS